MTRPVITRYQQIGFMFKLKDCVNAGDLQATLDLLDHYHSSTGKDDIIDTQDKNGWNGLMTASLLGNIDIVRALLERKPDLTLLNNKQRNALMIAASRSHKHIVELLLRHIRERELEEASSSAHHRHARPVILKKIVNQKDERGCTALLSAVSENHQEIASLLLQYGADPDPANDKGDTALLTVAGRPDSERLLSLILSAGVKVNAKNAKGWTALHWASFFGSPHNVRALLEKGASVHTRLQDGQHTPLSIAVQEGRTEACRILLDHGANADDVCAGWPIAMTACAKGHASILELFIEKGVKLRGITNDLGQTPLMVAARWNHVDCVKALLAKDSIGGLFRADPHATDPKGMTALAIASSSGSLESVRLLLSSVPDLDLDATSKGDQTALLLAANNKHTEICDLLIRAGASTSVQDSGGYDVLMGAISSHDPTTVLSLLQHSTVPLNRTTKNKLSILHLACSAKMPLDVLQKLLEPQFRLNINARDINGVTPLAIVIANDDIAAAHLFLENGASLSNVDNKGHSVLHLAVRNNNLEMARLLLEKRSTDPTSNFYFNVSQQNHKDVSCLHLACKRGNPEMVNLLLQHGADIYQFNTAYQSLIVTCTEGGHLDVAEIILQRDAELHAQQIAQASQYLDQVGSPSSNKKKTFQPINAISPAEFDPTVASLNHQRLSINGTPRKTPNRLIDAADHHGWNPLLLAVHKGDHLAVNFLLKHGANPFAMNESKQNAITIAAVKGHYDLTEMFLQLGVPIDQFDDCDMTPFHYACFCYRTRIIDLLIQYGADPFLKTGKGRNAITLLKGRRPPDSFVPLFGLEQEEVATARQNEAGEEGLLGIEEPNLPDPRFPDHINYEEDHFSNYPPPPPSSSFSSLLDTADHRPL